MDNISTKGLGFARLVQAKAVAKGDAMQALRYAEGRGSAWGNTPGVFTALKALVNPLDTANGSPLVAARPLANEFLELVRPRSLIDRIVGLRQVPHNISVLKVTGGAAVWWVGEAAPIPVGRYSLDRETLMPDKAAGIIVTTSELARASGEVAERTFRQELVRGVSGFLDRSFIDPALGPVANISPGSITHGITPISSSGSSLAAVQDDLKALFANFTANDGQIEDAVIVMNPRTALSLSMLSGTGGAPAFPKIGARGGEIGGVPVLTTSAAAASGSPGETFMVMFDPAQILISDDGDLTIDYSLHGSVQLSDTPGSGAQQLVSLWQNGLVGLRAERYVTWRRTSNNAVAVLDNIAY